MVDEIPSEVRLRVGEDALHLVVDHTLEDQLGVGVGQVLLLKPPALLPERNNRKY